MKTIRCPQCNLVNFSTAINCKRCGHFFQEVSLETPQNTNAENQTDTFSVPPPQNINPPNPTPPQAWTPPSQSQSNYQSQNYSNNRFGSQNPSQQKIKMAVISMILGIMSFPIIIMIIGTILSIVLAIMFGATGAIIGIVITLAILPTGLITGITALVKANRNPNEYGGKGFAIAGIVLSGFSILVIPVVAAIAIPNLLAARKAANEGSAISSIRTLADAQETYRGVKNTQICGDLTELAQNNLIDSVLAGGTKSGYVFFVSKLPQGCEIFATPVNAKGVSATGIRSFYYSTEDQIIRAGKKDGQLASKIDLPLDDGFSTSEPTTRPKIASQR